MPAPHPALSPRGRARGEGEFQIFLARIYLACLREDSPPEALRRTVASAKASVRDLVLILKAQWLSLP